MTMLILLGRIVLAGATLALLAAMASEGVGLIWVSLLILALAGWCITQPWRRGANSEPSPPLWTGLPRWLANLLVILALLASGSRAFSGEAPVSVFMTFLAGMLVIKLWQRRELRDAGQALTLSLFLTLGATLNRNDLGVGLCMILQAPVLLAGAIIFQLLLARSRALPESHDVPRDWAQLRRPLLTHFAAGLAVAFAIGVVVFLLTPRGIGIISRLGTFGQPITSRVSGLSNQIDLNQGGLISQSPRIVMSVAIKSQRSEELFGSSDRLLYLRALVLDEYTRGRWTASTTNDVRVRKLQGGTNNQISLGTSASPFSETQLLVRTIAPLRPQDPFVSLWRPSGLSLPIENDTDATIEYNPTHELITFQSIKGARSISSYEVDQVTQPRTFPATRRGGVSWPDDAVTALAREALRAANIDPDPATRSPDADAAAVRVLESWLRTRCEYTLDPPIPPISADPILWFLTTSKRGHCEYFASALAALTRSIGIDARVVGGYLTNEFDVPRKEYTVRDSDAHAWIEAEVAPGLWRTFDATPESRPEYTRPAPSGLLAIFSGFGSTINNFWNTNVVSFDKQSQERLLGLRAPDRTLVDQSWLARWINPASLQSRPEAARAMARIARLIALWLAIFIVVLVASTGLAAYLRKRARQRPRDGWSFATSRRLRAQRREILREASQNGLAKLPHESLAQHASKAQDQATRARLLERVQRLYAARFAPPTTQSP